MSPKHWIDFLLGLALSALILLGIDTALGSLGLGPIAEATNWSRGFDPQARYLVPLADRPGAWQTRFKHKKNPEVSIPAKSDKVRVITFGGSNTHGFPTQYLRKLLDKNVKDGKPDGRRFEVINLGRPGYGSERVKFIFEQAIECLEPDVVIIYTGHNEFVERGFQMDLESMGAADWAQAPMAAARKTHLFNAITEYYGDSSTLKHAEPEAWDNEYSKFADISYDETLTYFDAYGENVAAMCEMAQAKGLRTVLCTVIYNRLAVPFSSAFSKEASPADIKVFEEKRKGALRRLPTYTKLLLPEIEKKRLHGSEFVAKKLVRGAAGVRLDTTKFDGWRDATGFLKGREPGLQPPSRWDPLVHKFYDALRQLQERSLGDKRMDQVVRAEILLKEALAIFPDHPRALFELGITKTILGGDPKTIRALFYKAASLDRAPRKGSEATNDIVRRVAAQNPSITFLDIDSMFQQCVPNALVGWEWMADHCHLNRGARNAAMEIFSETLLDTWPDLLTTSSGSKLDSGGEGAQ